ncbi:hypothetical protein VE03_10317 [Pseudogymnoascus sp. 23342-1-I1]|nr:hypothetical protein VE03_10317 [Pseudogymnoascus sp. 23342-1-I1]
MRFQLLALLGLASASAATQWSGMENLPNGAYSGVNHPDGSTTVTSLESGKTYDFSLSNRATKQTRRSDYAITKRDTSCWSYQLDHTGVDQGVINLKNWAGSGVGLSSGDSPSYYGFNNNGVYVYYCINKAHSSGNLDINDIDYALRQMDSNCASYEAGYFLWPNRVELVGKCRSGTPVCLG